MTESVVSDEATRKRLVDAAVHMQRAKSLMEGLSRNDQQRMAYVALSTALFGLEGSLGISAADERDFRDEIPVELRPMIERALKEERSANPDRVHRLVQALTEKHRMPDTGSLQ